MAAFYRATGSHEPLVISAFGKTGGMEGVLSGVIVRDGSGLKRRVSARAVVFGGPLVAGGADHEKTATALLAELDKLAGRKAIFVQFRNLYDMSQLAGAFLKSHYRFEEHLDIHIDLGRTEEALWKEISRRKRTYINNAARDGITVKKLNNDDPLQEIHSILAEVYHRIRLPLPGLSFFEAARKNLSPAGMYHEFGVMHENRILAVMFLLSYKSTVYNWYAGSRRDFSSYHPNEILHWDIIRWGRQNGFTLFDMGGAGKPGKPYGVRNFKEKFGGATVNYGRFEKVYNPLMMKMAITGFRAWQTFRW
jgi:predicted N-acyltransferase